MERHYFYQHPGTTPGPRTRIIDFFPLTAHNSKRLLELTFRRYESHATRPDYGDGAFDVRPAAARRL